MSYSFRCCLFGLLIFSIFIIVCFTTYGAFSIKDTIYLKEQHDLWKSGKCNIIGCNMLAIEGTNILYNLTYSPEYTNYIDNCKIAYIYI